MPTFEPEDSEDALFHHQFGWLREVVVHAARGLVDRIRGKVAEAERTPPRLSDVVTGGFVEMMNVVSRALGVDSEDDDHG